MKIGDLVKIPEDNHYWWGGKVGVIIGIGDLHQSFSQRTLRLLVAADNPGFSHVKFGANFVELISEAK